MKWLNVMGFAISGVVCAGLLSACADGRGANGFKSYQYSKEERAQNKAEYDALNKGETPPQQNAPAADDSQHVGDVAAGSTRPPVPEQGHVGPVFHEPAPSSPPTGKPDQAKPEPQPNPSGVIPLSAKVQDLNVIIDEELKGSEKSENKIAKDLIKGITILPSGSDEGRAITIQAMVVIGGEEVVMDAANVPVKFLKPEENLTNILFTLTKPCDQKPINVLNLLQAGAKCRDEQCLVIEVILSFETQDPSRRATAILVVNPGTGRDGKPEWQYSKTNIGVPKTFIEAQKTCPTVVAAPKAEHTEPEEVKTRSSIAVRAEAARRLKAKKKPSANLELGKSDEQSSASDEKSCEELRKEGFMFNCKDSSPEAIARIRKAHAALAAARAKKAKVEENGAADKSGAVVSPASPAAPPIEQKDNDASASEFLNI